jgi:hypothetical protein
MTFNSNGQLLSLNEMYPIIDCLLYNFIIVYNLFIIWVKSKHRDSRPFSFGFVSLKLICLCKTPSVKIFYKLSFINNWEINTNVQNILFKQFLNDINYDFECCVITFCKGVCIAMCRNPQTISRLLDVFNIDVTLL